MKNSTKNTKPGKIRRILALAGALLLFGMYAATILFAFIDHSSTQGLLKASVFPVRHTIRTATCRTDPRIPPALQPYLPQRIPTADPDHSTVLTALYSAKPPCLSAHLLRWIFYPQPPLRRRRSALQMNGYSAKSRQFYNPFLLIIYTVPPGSTSDSLPESSRASGFCPYL